MNKILILSAFDNYSYAVRIKYVEKYFENIGYDVSILSADFDHRNKRKYQVERKNLNYVHVRPYKKNLSIARILSHREFAQKAFKYAEKVRPDIIYVSTPPNFLFRYANMYKKKHKTSKIIFEIGDMWPETLPVSDNIKKLISPCLNIWRMLRNKYMRCADGVVFECELFYKHLRDIVAGIPSEIIYLTKDLNGKETKVSAPSLKNGLSFCYVGSLNNIFDENLTSKFLNQIALKYPVTFHLIGGGEKKNQFLKMLKNVKIIDHGIVYDETEKAEIYSQCHMALNLMKTNVFVGLTMKSIEYFAAGLPVINNIPEDTKNIVEKNGCGFNYTGDMDDVIAWLETLNDRKIDDMKNESYKIYEENFKVQVFDNKLKKLLENVI